MRRIFSITTIAALICSAASPLLAAACPHCQPAMACHRAKAQHPQCPMMHHHQSEEASGTSDLAEIQGAPSPANCPMDCCTSGHPQGIAAAAAMTMSPSLVMLDQSMLWSPIVFTHSGFSSHTDRGPPIS
jgi:hypothetical protein